MPAAAAVTAAATAPATAAALGLRPRFVYDQVSAAEILTVQRIHGAIGFFVVVDFNKRESARLAGETIANQIYRRRTDTRLRKKIMQLILRRGERKISHVELLHLRTPSARIQIASRGAR
jgi:hypothetical protein